MKNQTKKPKVWTRKRVIITLLAAVLTIFILLGAIFGFYKARYYKEVADQASIVQIRELILLAIRGIKKDAPVDPKTGDIYFPESRLYLPNPMQAFPLTYLYDIGDVSNSQSELSVSTYPVRGTTGLYSAMNMEQLFEAVPKLQACSRGIKLVHNKFPSNDAQNQLKQTVHLNNGQTIYVYVEKNCPELNETADLFTRIQSY